MADFHPQITGRFCPQTDTDQYSPGYQSAAVAAVQDEVPIQPLVRARRIEIVGESDNVVAILGRQNGRGFLQTKNDEGKRLVLVSGTADGKGGLSVFDPGTDKAIVSVYGRDKDGAIKTCNSQGQAMVIHGRTSDGQGAIITRDPARDADLVSIGANRTDGMITTYDARTKKVMTRISTDGSRGGGVNSYDSKGKQYNHPRMPVR